MLKNDFDRFIKMIQDIKHMTLIALWVELPCLRAKVAEPVGLIRQV